MREMRRSVLNMPFYYNALANNHKYSKPKRDGRRYDRERIIKVQELEKTTCRLC